MGVKVLKFNIFRGSKNRHALFRALIIVSALSVVPLMELLPKSVSSNDAALEPKLFLSKLVEPFLGKLETEKYSEVVISDLAEELVDLELLHYDAKVLCIGPGSDSAVSVFKQIGFSDVYEVPKHPLFPFFSRKHKFELELSGEELFDFVFSMNVDQVISPALLVLEMERVLIPGGIGAVLVSTNDNDLVKPATLVSLWLKQSKIVHINYLDEFTIIVFKRNVTESQLPRDCQSLETKKPYIEFMEPLHEQKPVDFPKTVVYLPNLLDLSLKKRFVYIDIGAAKHLSTKSTSNWFFQSYPLESKAFDAYFVDHNTSVMLSYVKKPGITFVYHPGLAEDNTTGRNVTPLEQLKPFPEDEDFNFLAWFEETAKYADFVILKMNTSEVEMEFLSVLLTTGSICYVDELFLRCKTLEPDCINMLQNLRTRGVFVHQWWED